MIRRIANWPNGSCAGTVGAPCRPPRHHRGVGQQERQHHAAGVVGELTVQAQRHDLARTRVGADPQLRVQSRLGGACDRLAPPRSPGTGARGWRSWPPRWSPPAASSESSEITSVSTRPIVIAPPSSRRPMIFLLMSLVVVSAGRRSLLAPPRITAASIPGPCGASSRRRRRSPCARFVGIGLAVRRPSNRARDRGSPRRIRPPC